MRTLKLTSGPAAGREITLDRELVIGRSGADFDIDDSELSRRHAVLRPVDGGVEIEDLGSTNGTFVDGRRIDAVTRITERSTIQMGTTEIELELDFPEPERSATAVRSATAEPPPTPPPSPVPDEDAPPPGQEGRTLLRIVTGTAPGTMVPVGAEPFTIGRGEAGMGMLDGDPKLSRSHARISKVDGRVVVEDLGSTNGTFVNGTRIAAPTVLRPGDALYLGTTSLQLIEFAPGEISRIARAGSSTLGRIRGAETTVLERLAALCSRRPKRLLGATAAFFVIAVFFGAPVVGLLPSHPAPDPAVESTIATEDIEEASGLQLSPNVIALVRAQGGPDSDATRARVERVVETMEEEPLVGRVIDPVSTDDPALVSQDGELLTVAAIFKNADLLDIDEAGEELETDLQELPGVLVGGPGRVGPQVGETVGEDIGKAERLAFPILLLASIFIFRGFVAALLPLYVGILTVFSTFFALRIVNAAFTEISIFALNMVIALGLGLAIDYSLFIVSRYREELRRYESAEALRRTLKTAGRTVIFSALTVAAALGCLGLFPQRFVYSMGIGGALCALIAMVISLTALPALLMALGPRVNALSPKRWRRGLERDPGEEHRGFWYRLSQLVMKRPLPFALGSAFVLLALGSAFLRIEFTGLDVTVLPKDSEVRQVDELQLTRFETSRSRQINLAIDAAPEDRAAVMEYADELKAFPGVADVGAPQQLSGALWKVDVFPERRELDDQTLDLVREIRDQPAPFPCGGGRPERRVPRPAHEHRGSHPAGNRCADDHHGGGAVRAHRLGDPAAEGARDEHPHRERGLWAARADLPGRPAGGLTGL